MDKALELVSYATRLRNSTCIRYVGQARWEFCDHALFTEPWGTDARRSTCSVLSLP